MNEKLTEDEKACLTVPMSDSPDRNNFRAQAVLNGLSVNGNVLIPWPELKTIVDNPDTFIELATLVFEDHLDRILSSVR